VVILSVTEGGDKPLKYPDMFHAWIPGTAATLARERGANAALVETAIPKRRRRQAVRHLLVQGWLLRQPLHCDGDPRKSAEAGNRARN